MPPLQPWETLFDYATRKKEVLDLEAEMAAPNFWDDQKEAQKKIDRLKTLKTIVTPLEALTASAKELPDMLELGEEEEAFAQEVTAEIKRLEEECQKLRLKALLSGPHDAAAALVSVYARDGGTDANDWAEMILRMYTLWGQKNEYKIQLVDKSENEEAGINSAAIVISGPMAYGYLKGETGIHRLVRISPFNSEGKRQTSFAAVDVSPVIDDEAEVEIDEADVRVDTFRASGAGGQHVNKTDSAIRLTHIPTGIVAQCQSERSQHKNRATAWKMLRSRLARLEEEKREAEQADKHKSKARVGFGSQIRNYFLHPDQRVKDARTGYTEGSFHKVLDGEIQGFLESFLRLYRGQEEGES
ncbi:MAG: peptide chain release factor 2 [Pirellulaceae bacterium]|nr:peptide chain release factor 2 [Pirellulaceae bacterium]